VFVPKVKEPEPEATKLSPVSDPVKLSGVASDVPGEMGFAREPVANKITPAAPNEKRDKNFDFMRASPKRGLHSTSPKCNSSVIVGPKLVFGQAKYVGTIDTWQITFKLPNFGQGQHH
jgi:hypothetical protein